MIGHKEKDNILKLVNNLELPELFSKMNQIFKKRIRHFIKPILQENHSLITEDSLNIIKTGFNIFILLTIFKEAFPSHASLHLLDQNLSFSNKRYQELRLQKKRDLSLSPKKTIKKNSKQILPLESPPINRANMKKKQNATYVEFTKTKSVNTGFKKFNEDDKMISNNIDESESFKHNSDGLLENDDLNKSLGEFDKERIKEKYKEYYELNSQKNMKASLLFYKGLVGSVEVQRGDELSKIYFQKPFVSDFKTANIKYNLIYNANRESDQARLEHLFYNVDKYYQEMKHRQLMYRYRILNFFIEFWRTLKDFSFVLIILINILILSSYSNDSDTSDDKKQALLDDTTQIFTIIQLVICFLVVLFCMIERYPVSIHAQIGNFTAIKKNNLKNQAGLEISNRGFFQQFVINWEIKIENYFKLLEESRYKYLKMLFDSENIYNLLYLAITLIAFFYPLVYCVLLMDLIKRSEDLQNIIKAVTLNVGSLIKTAILGSAVLFMFSVVGYLEFPEFYKSDGNSIVYADTLLHAYTSTLNSGLRAGGGIGDSLSGPLISKLFIIFFIFFFCLANGKYWNYWVFTLAFYIIINILFINIIFGIIIDTFGELRDMRKALIKDVEDKCFICGVDSYDFETKSFKFSYKEGISFFLGEMDGLIIYI